MNLINFYKGSGVDIGSFYFSFVVCVCERERERERENRRLPTF